MSSLTSRPLRIASALLLSLLLAPLSTWAQSVGIRDVPLKPWMGLGRSWDWTYDALQKLVLSGITGKVVLNTKPMSRREMALILADTIRRIQANRVTEFDQRYDLNQLLLQLMDEFSPELLALGVTGYGIRGEAPRVLEVKPLQYLQFRGAYVSKAATDLENSNGERLDRGMNARVASASWLEAGGYLAAYAHPEFQISPDEMRGQLIEGYVKGRIGPVEVLAGREPLWWGPGFHGSMLFSNNSLGLDMIRLQTANQITLPWVLGDVFGPMKFQWIYGARFENERTDFPRSKVTAMRVDMTPFQWLEVGLGREITFDGNGRQEVPIWEYPRVLVQSNRPGTETSKYAGDNRWEADIDIRLADVGKYFPITRDLELYLDFGWDDTCCGTFYTPLKPGALVGLYLPNLFGSPDRTFRVEYSNSSSFQFTHSTWADGYIRKGHVISDLEGTAGEDLFFRLTQRLDKQIEVGVELDLARRGQTQQGLAFSTKELHRYFGVDVSYLHSKNLSLNLEWRIEWVNNRDFVAGKKDVNLVSMIDVTYAFDPVFGAGPRDILSSGPTYEEAPPAKVPDPDQILSWDYGAKVAKDGWSILTSPLRWDTKDWLILGGVAAATGGAMLLDNEVRHVTQNNRSNAGDNAANIMSNLAFIAPAVGGATSYIMGEAFGNVEAKQRAADGIEAAVLSNLLITYPMKFLIGRSRPSADEGSQSYHPFNASGSMPSFHVTEAFAAASVLSEHMDNPWVSALAYGAATGVGWARIYEDKHWFSDVVLSAAIGTAVGKAVVYLNRHRRETGVSVIPLASRDMWGAAVRVEY